MSRILSVGSLFSGFGGLDLGLEQTGGFQIAWQVEKDDYCEQVLRKHWPHVARFRDVRDCGAHNLSAVDVLAGGLPCQDISISGKRAGLEGVHSGLWSHFARLICELRPRYVIVENVPALRFPLKRAGNRKPAPLSRVLGDLARLRYDAQWELLPASAFGAPHHRWRFFLVAYPNGFRSQTLFPQPRLFRAPQTTGARELLALCSGTTTGRQDCQRLLWTHEPGVDRVADGVAAWVERLRGLGNAVVPAVARYVGECVAAWDDEHSQFEARGGP